MSDTEELSRLRRDLAAARKVLDEWTHPPRVHPVVGAAWVLLDSYELTNLHEALKAIMTNDSPLAALNTGDWVGQIRWALEPIAAGHHPNASAPYMADNARKWKP